MCTTFGFQGGLWVNSMAAPWRDDEGVWFSMEAPMEAPRKHHEGTMETPHLGGITEAPSWRHHGSTM